MRAELHIPRRRALPEMKLRSVRSEPIPRHPVLIRVNSCYSWLTIFSSCVRPGSTIASDRLDWAFLEGGLAGALLLGAIRLQDDVAAAVPVVAPEVPGAVSRQRSQSMQVAST